MEFQNIVIALPLEEELLKPLYEWGKRFDWSHVGNVHFVHSVKKNITPLEFGLMEMPDENTFKEMLPVMNKFMSEESKKIVSPPFQGKTHFHLSSHFNPAEEITNTIKSLKASLVVISTRGKHGFEGLFSSSFTDHMVRFAPCDVYVIRPK
jgi:hypothetical protein